VHPRAEKKIGGGRNLQGQVVSAPPGIKIFEEILCCAGEIWRVGVVNLAFLACVLRATTKKGRQLSL